MQAPGHVRAVIAALVPSTEARTGFRHGRAEADFRRWCEANPAASFRRFEVRLADQVYEPLSTTSVDEQRLTLTVVVAYPHGDQQSRRAALGRDDVQRADRHQIEAAIGLIDLANFVDPRAKWTSGTTTRTRGTGVDFLTIRQDFTFYRSQP